MNPMSSRLDSDTVHLSSARASGRRGFAFKAMDRQRAGSLVAALLILGSVVVTRGRDERSQNVHDFMRAKLVHCQKVLEGLTMENYATIARHSRSLSSLSQQATWHVLQTPEYAQRSTEFRRCTESLAEAADKGNLDGVTLAYVAVTLKCVDCHKYVRRIQHASRTPPPGAVARNDTRAILSPDSLAAASGTPPIR